MEPSQIPGGGFLRVWPLTSTPTCAYLGSPELEQQGASMRGPPLWGADERLGM